MVGGIIRICIDDAIPWRREAGQQSGFTRAAAPGEPAKVARLRAVRDVGDDGPY